MHYLPQSHSSRSEKHLWELKAVLNISSQPCQALFVAPCSHTWHFKCIRHFIDDSYPQFLCPNCRAHTDLSAEIEEELEDFEQDDESITSRNNEATPQHIVGAIAGSSRQATAASQTDFDDPDATQLHLALPTNGGISESPPSIPAQDRALLNLQDDPDLSWAMRSMSIRDRSLRLASLDDTITASADRCNDLHGRATILNPSASAFVPSPSSPVTIPRSSHTRASTLDSAASAGTAEDEAGDRVPDLEPQGEPIQPRRNGAGSASRTVSVDALGREGPMTPRNDAGPFVLDGGAATSSHGTLTTRAGREAGRSNTLD